MPGQPVDIGDPLGGLDRQLAFQNQKPYTTPDCLNMRPRDVLQRRARLGSRPGLSKAFLQQLSGTSVDLIAEVREKLSTAGAVLDEPFTSEMTDPPWDAPSWLGRFPRIISGAATFHPDDGLLIVGARHDALSPIIDVGTDGAPDSNTKEYGFRVQGTIRPDAGSGVLPPGVPTEFRLYLRMPDNEPDGLTDVVIITVGGVAQSSVSGSYYVAMEVRGSTGAVVPADSAGGDSILVGLSYADFDLTVRVGINGLLKKLQASCDFSPAGNNSSFVKTLTTAAAGQRFAFGLFRSTTERSCNVFVNNFTLNYQKDTSGFPASGVRTRLITVGNSRIYEENNASQLIDVTTSPTATITAGRLLQAVDLRGVLYIANHSGATDAGILRYTPADDLLRDLQRTTPTGTVFIQISTIPQACEVITSYRDGIVLAGQRGDANEWHISKRGADPATAAAWTADFTSTSYTLGSTSEAGRVGEPITALIRHSDDYLIFGCLNSLWILRGEPNYGGTLDVLASRNGVISSSAWCRGPNDYTFYLSHDGLYGIAPGGLSYPEALSYGLPDELRLLNVQQNRVFLAYDVVEQGVYVAITRIDGGAGKYFFFDVISRRVVDEDSFASIWPDQFQGSHEPTFLYYYGADAPNQRALLFGGRDGFIRAFDRRATTDDRLPFTSYSLIGPIALGGGGYYDGMFLEYVGQLAADSGNMTAELMIGNSIEAAFRSTPRFAMPLRPGKNLTYRPRLRGNACFLKLSKSSDAATAVENQTIVRQRLGKQRL